MAFATLKSGHFGTASNSGTGLSITTNGAVAAGSLLVLYLAKKNAATSNGNTSEVTTVIDSKSNTWVKAREYCNSRGVAGGGVTISVWYSVLTTGLASADQVQATLSTSVRSAGILWGYSMGAGSRVSVVANATDVASIDANPANQTVSGLTSGEYLFVRGLAAETNSFGFTSTTNYTATGTNNSDSGTASTSAQVAGEWRILTGTGDTVTSTCGAVDTAGVFLAFKELPLRTADFDNTLGSVSLVTTGGSVVSSPVRYIRETMNGATNGNTTNYWVDIQAYDESGTNVANGKTASVISGTIVEGTIGLLNDDSTDTNGYVAIAPDDGTSPCTVQIDLGAVYNITAISRWHYYGDGRTFTGIVVEVSVDGTTWYTIFSSAANGTYAETFAGKTTNAPYLTSGRNAALSATLGAVSLSASVSVANTRNANLSATLGTVTLSATGTSPESSGGSLTATLGVATLSASAKIGSNAALTKTLGAATASGAGSVTTDNTSPVRYIRETMNGANNGNPTNYWVEIQALDANGVNVALGKVPTAVVGTVGEGTLSMLTDGSTDTNGYVSLTGSGPCTMQIDLGQVYNLSAIKRWHYYGDGRTFFGVVLEVSSDGVEWVTIFSSATDGTYAETSAGKTTTAPFPGMAGGGGGGDPGSGGGDPTLVMQAYTEDTTTNFGNPDRGFTHTIDSGNSPHSTSLFQSYIDSGFTLVRMYVALDPYVNTASLPTSFINALKGSFDNMRAVGMKCYPRFAYNQTGSNVDAKKTILLGHIDQLTPILTSYHDVIPFMETGFVGPWGEWADSANYGSVNNTLSNLNLSAQNWADRQQILERILNGTPSTFYALLRMPMFKRYMYGTTALTDTERFNGSIKSRIGHHNDAFVSTSDDMGTYNNKPVESPYLAQETKFVPWGGETDYYPPRVNGAGADAEMALFHATYMNDDYHASVIQSWKDEGVYDKIARSLGYRLYVSDMGVSNATTVGGALQVYFKVHNRGYASPLAPRTTYLVLKGAGGTFSVPLSVDIRDWLPTSTTPYIINETVTLPTMPVGTYNVYLHFPDRFATLATKPSAAIRLANTGAWDSTTGMNSMSPLTVTIATSVVTQSVANMSATLGAVTHSADANVPISANLLRPLSPLTSDSSGTSSVVASLSQSLGSLTLVASQDAGSSANADITLDAMTLSADGTVFSGGASITLGEMTASATVGVEVSNRLFSQLGGMQSTSAAGATVTANLSAQIAGMFLSSNGTHPITANLNVTLDGMYSRSSGMGRNSNDSDIRCLLVEVDVEVGGTPTKRYLSSANYVTSPADTPANVAYEAIISGGIKFTEKLEIDGTAGLSFGDIELYNPNGIRDSWLDDMWVNKPLKVYAGDVRWPRAQFRQIFDGVVADIDSRSRDTLNLKIRDKMQRLNTSVTEDKLGGSTDNKDRVLPLCFGECHNVEPLLVDPQNLIYMVHHGAIERVIEVRDNGVPVRFTPDLANGKFTLVSPPAGQVTASVQGDKSPSYINTIADIIKALATRFGKASDRLSLSEIDTANFNTFNATCPQPVGIYLKERTNVIQAMQDLAKSVGAQVAVSRDGKLQIKRITFPVVSPSFSISKEDMMENNIAISSRSDVVAAVKIGYCKNWTVQQNITSGILEEHKVLFGQEWLTETQSDPVRAEKYKLSTEVTQRETLLLRRSDAEAEALRLLDMQSVSRTTYKFDSMPRLQELTLGQGVHITHPRYGLQGGKDGVVVSLSPNWLTGRVIVEVRV